MSYIKPDTVLSPREAVSNLKVLFDGGENSENNNWNGFSVAQLEWYGNLSIGVRWNGASENPIGNPQSRGIPTWFIVPTGLEELVKEYVRKIGAKSKQK